MKVHSYNIVKIEKGNFRVEYKEGPWTGKKTVDKRFKSITKATEWVDKNFELLNVTAKSKK